MLRMITNRSPSPAPRKQTGATPPRRLRGFPLPLWRGVNGIANNELITTLLTMD